MTDSIRTVSNSRERLIQLMLFLLLLTAFTYVLPRWADWSQNSRLNLTLAIVDDGTLSIDKYYKNTGDYALFEGKHYTDKAPGPSFLAVPVYLAVRPILKSPPVQKVIDRLSRSPSFAETLNADGTGLLTEKIYYATVLYLCTIAVISIPSAVLGVLMFQFLRYMGLGVGWAVGIILIYSLATSAFSYAGAFFSHQLVAVLLFGAFFIGYLVRQGRIAPQWIIAAGFMLGYSIISEYPTVLIVAAVGLYILFTLRPKRAVPAYAGIAFILASLPPVLLLMAYNWAIFRTPLPVGYKYSELYTDLHSQGLISLTYPHPDALWGITFGSFRGLFYISPVLLLAVVGFWFWWRSGKMRAEWAVCLWATLSFFLFNGSSVMWQGGFSIGPRYLVPMLPFLMMGLGAFALRWGDQLWARALTLALAIWSFFVVWAQTLGGQNYPDWTPEPLFNYSLPRLMANDVARNLGMIVNLRGWMSLLPLAVVLTILMLILAWYINRPLKRRQGERGPRVRGDDEFVAPISKLGKNEAAEA